MATSTPLMVSIAAGMTASTVTSMATPIVATILAIVGMTIVIWPSLDSSLVVVASIIEEIAERTELRLLAGAELLEAKAEMRLETELELRMAELLDAAELLEAKAEMRLEAELELRMTELLDAAELLEEGDPTELLEIEALKADTLELEGAGDWG
ncbi:hypothetical protein V8F33_014197 [Rhypophila sp. PSN 637]